MAVALSLLCLALWSSNADFFGASNVVNTARQIAMLGILAIGIAFVIIAGGIDLSVGSVVGLTGVITARLSSTQAGGLGEPLWFGIGAGLGAALLVGLLQGLLITRLKLQPFIVTLAGMLLVRGVSQTIVDGGVISLGNSRLLNLANGGILHFGRDPLIGWSVLIFCAVAALAGYVLHYTVLGRYIYAIGGSRDAAFYSGVHVDRVELLTYVISAGCAGVAGLCYAAYIGQMSQQVGIAYELYAIAAAVLGGCSLRGGEGTILGTFIGASIMRVIDNGINMFQFEYDGRDGVRRVFRLNPNWNWIIVGTVILLAVVLDQLVHLAQAARRTRGAVESESRQSPATEAGEPERPQPW